MKLYNVYKIIEWMTTVEAENRDEAIQLAKKPFTEWSRHDDDEYFETEECNEHGN